MPIVTYLQTALVFVVLDPRLRDTCNPIRSRECNLSDSLKKPTTTTTTTQIIVTRMIVSDEYRIVLVSDYS